jgi:hypothetical protein
MISSNRMLFFVMLGFIFLNLSRYEIALASDVESPHTQVIIAVDEKAGDDHDDAYYRRLLNLALEKTVSTFGPYDIKIVPFIYIDSRLIRAVEENKVSVTWRHYQQNVSLPLRPIKIDLLKKMGDYRVFLIRENDQARFSNINSLDDLRKFRGGMGAQWPDRSVMEKNGLPLVFSVNYYNLFKMLKANRFDYFSRGIYQVQPELNVKANRGLVLEDHLMLQYSNPLFFFVNEKNTVLAERIELGLSIAIADGSFDAVFNAFPRFAWAQQLLDENKRRIFTLDQ